MLFQENIVRFDISVNDSEFMDLVDRLTYLLNNFLSGHLRKPFVLLSILKISEVSSLAIFVHKIFFLILLKMYVKLDATVNIEHHFGH